MAQKFLGVDIGNNGISVLLMESGISGNRIGDYRYVPFEERLHNDATITATLQAALAGLNIAGARCMASIPARHVFFRNLRLPAFEPKKIRPILLFELEPLLPFPVENLITDFTVFLDPENPDQTNVITATIQKAELSRHLSIFRAAGFEPEGITFQGCALAFCLSNLTETPEDWIFVDMEGSSAALFVFKSRQLALIRCVSISSGENFFHETLPQGILQTICTVEGLFTDDYLPQMIWIRHEETTGNENRFQTLENQLGVPVKPNDLSRALTSKKKLDAGSLKVSSGQDAVLALTLLNSERIRGIHFLQGAFSPRTRWIELKSPLLKAGLMMSTALLFAGVYLFMDLRFARARVSRLNTHLTQMYQTVFPEEKGIVDPVSQMKARLESFMKQSISIQGKGTRIRRVDLLNEISTRIPIRMDVEILRLTAGEADMVLFGNTDTFNSVNDLKNQLEGSRLFQEIIITSTNLNRTGNRVDFILTIRL